MGRRVDLTSARLVALMDGPMSGEWFHFEDWHQLVVGAQFMRDVQHQQPQACLGYVQAAWTTDAVAHPHWKGVTGEPWFYRDAERSQVWKFTEISSDTTLSPAPTQGVVA